MQMLGRLEFVGVQLCQIQGVLIFGVEETDVDDKCDFFQWADGKTKVKKSMKKKKRDLKRLQKRTSAVEKPKKVIKRIKPLQSSDEEK